MSTMVNTVTGPLGSAELNKALPNWRMTHLFEHIFPELECLGMSQDDLDQIVIENPRRYFDEAAAPR